MSSDESEASTPSMHDMGTQTERHPVEKLVDRSYEWNEWELRRRAIQQANCRTNRKCSTMQTNLSHMRRDTVNQAFPPRKIACQSMRDAGTTMPRPFIYVAGLRGEAVSLAIKTDLTVDTTLTRPKR